MITFFQLLSCSQPQSSNHHSFPHYKNWIMFPLLFLCRLILLGTGNWEWLNILYNIKRCLIMIIRHWNFPYVRTYITYVCCIGTGVNILILLYIWIYGWNLASVQPASTQYYFLILSRIFCSIWLNYPQGSREPGWSTLWQKLLCQHCSHSAL